MFFHVTPTPYPGHSIQNAQFILRVYYIHSSRYNMCEVAGLRLTLLNTSHNMNRNFLF